jgi:hypothetical protein
MYHPWFELKTFVIDMMCSEDLPTRKIYTETLRQSFALPLVTRDDRTNEQTSARFTPRRRSETKHGVAVVRAEYF